MDNNHSRSTTSKDLHLVIEVLKKYLSSDDFEIKSFDICPASKDHIGFLGEHWKISIHYIFKEKSFNVSFFYKTFPKSNEFQATYSTEFGFWGKETFIYPNIFNKFKQFEDTRQCTPNCYFTSGEDLVFEDLNARGFQMRELRKPMDTAHAIAVIKGLARFHGCTFILEENESLRLNRLYRMEKEYKEVFSIGNFMKSDWYYHALDQALKVASTSKKYGKNTIYYDKVTSKWKELSTKAIELIDHPSKENRNVLIHLDLWNNNMMFKYDKLGHPIQCIFVDYQCCRISKPAADIAAFAYLCLNKQIRDDIFDKLVEIYHEELGQVLEESEFNVNSILSLKDLRLTCEEYRMWGLVQSQVLFQFLFMDEEDKMAMSNNSESFQKLAYEDRSEVIKKSFEKNVDYKRRMMEVVDEYIERYII